jgi:4-alpha-glucanotransferase
MKPEPARAGVLPVLDRRRSGILLHPSSLLPPRSGPGAPPPRGALGAAARAFIDWLCAAGASVWQVLPLGPVGEDGSPYWVRSDQAGNPDFIDLHEAPDPLAERGDFEDFCARERGWLEDYVLFAALGRAQGAAPWWHWPEPLRDRHAAALARAALQLAPQRQALRVEQWRFDRQWNDLRRYAHERGVRLYGDLPIYLAPNSVATWTARHQFQLLPDGRPALLAGVPPDYFAADGQLWGNPLYDWSQAQRDGFAFWRARIECQLRRFDIVRIDHFRGLAGYWAVPAGARTAREGRWMPAPGAELLTALREAQGVLPLVAEDLGVITPDVDALRQAFELPGMRVLQFGFDGSPDNPHLPYNFRRDVVAYTGTHDNDTSLGWYRSLDGPTRRRVEDFLGAPPVQMPQALVRAVLASVAVLAMVPVQDVLGLGGEARFNVPGTVGGNWGWRLEPGALKTETADAHRALNESYGRLSHR